MEGLINKIESVTNIKLGNTGKLNGSKGSRLGFTGMLNSLCGYGEYDGYKIETDQHDYHILIENGQSCCEDWGYFASEDDFNKYIGKELREVRCTDTALKQETLKERCKYGFDEGGIQFVDFVMTDGTVLQFAVYNAHNGYYGHSILVAKDEEIILSDTL